MAVVLPEPAGAVIRKHQALLDQIRSSGNTEGGTLNETSALVSKQPVTLQDLATYFIHTWPLIDVLKNNFEDDLDAALNFFDAESPFYPELDDLLRLMVIHAFPEQSDEEDDAESDKQ